MAHELFSDNWLYSLKLQNSFHLLLKRHKGQTFSCWSVQTLLWKLEDNCVNFYASWNLYKYLEEVKTRQHCLVMIFATSFLKDFSWTLFFWIWKFLLPNSITMLTTTFEGLTIPQGPPWIQWKTFRLTWFFDKMHFIGHIFWCIVFLFPLLNHPTFGSDAHIWKILNYFNWSWDIFN